MGALLKHSQQGQGHPQTTEDQQCKRNLDKAPGGALHHQAQLSLARAADQPPLSCHWGTHEHRQLEHLSLQLRQLWEGAAPTSGAAGRALGLGHTLAVTFCYYWHLLLH